MDINSIKAAVEKLTKDSATQASFKENPVKAVESIIGVDLPDEMVDSIIKMAKAKLDGKDIAEMLKAEAGEMLKSGIADKLKSMLK